MLKLMNNNTTIVSIIVTWLYLVALTWIVCNESHKVAVLEKQQTVQDAPVQKIELTITPSLYDTLTVPHIK